MRAFFEGLAVPYFFTSVFVAIFTPRSPARLRGYSPRDLQLAFCENPLGCVQFDVFIVADCHHGTVRSTANVAFVSDPKPLPR